MSSTLAIDDLASERALLQEILQPLHAALDAFTPQQQRLQDARPVVQLTLAVDAHTSSTASVGAQLAAFAALARYAHRLQRGSSKRRRSFWMHVLTSSMMPRTWSNREHWECVDSLPRCACIAPWMLEARDGPVLHVVLRLQRNVTPDLDSMFAPLQAVHVDATCVINVTLDVNRLDRSQPNLAADVLGLATRVFAREDVLHRPFVLHSVRCDSRSASALVSQRGWALTVNELDIVQTSSSNTTRTPDDDADTVHQLLSAVLVPPSCSTLSTSTLQRMRVCGYVGEREFAAVGSALRYGCSLETLELECAMTALSADACEQSWRWLAFGLFHPRARTITRTSPFTVRKLVLAHMTLSQSDADAFKQTLQNPATLAFARGSVPATASAHLQLVTLAVDAAVHETPSRSAPRIELQGLNDEPKHELESICELDGWYCIVVPGCGLGWIESQHLIAVYDVECEHSDALVGRYDLTLASPRLRSADLQPQALRVWLATVGAQLQALSIVDATCTQAFVQVVRAVGRHCRHLQHLALSKCSIVTPVSNELLKVLQSDLGRRLRSLDLNTSRFRAPRVLEQLSELLTQSETLQALQELRVDVRPLTAETLTNLNRALSSHTSLVFLELQDRYPHEYAKDKALARVRREFSAAHQGHVLSAAVTMASRQRAAFLSVVVGRRRLDTPLLLHVFAFASDVLRIRISWRIPPPAPSRY